MKVVVSCTLRALDKCKVTSQVQRSTLTPFQKSTHPLEGNPPDCGDDAPREGRGNLMEKRGTTSKDTKTPGFHFRSRLSACGPAVVCVRSVQPV